MQLPFAILVIIAYYVYKHFDQKRMNRERAAFGYMQSLDREVRNAKMRREIEEKNEANRRRIQKIMEDSRNL